MTHVRTFTADFLADCHRTQRAEKEAKPQLIRLVMESAGLKALLGYRLGRHLLMMRAAHSQPLLRALGWLCYWLINGYAQRALDIHLDLSADIGPGLYIGHFGNILVRQCTLGSHCSIAQSVHIEPDGDGDGDGPIIGDRVWIGAHAQVIGSYRVGDRSTIGAGARVRRDIPEGALFMGSPGRVVMSDYDNNDILL